MVSDLLARMLANPLRARVLAEYQAETTSPSKVAKRLDESLNLVSYHTDVLVRHRCLELVRTARRRGATEHFYRCTVRPIIEDDEWARLPLSARHALTLSYLGIAAYEARQAGLSGGFDGAQAHLSRTLLQVDEAGLVAVSQLLRRTLLELADIEGGCRTRGASGLQPYELVMLSFARS